MLLQITELTSVLSKGLFSVNEMHQIMRLKICVDNTFPFPTHEDILHST